MNITTKFNTGQRVSFRWCNITHIGCILETMISIKNTCRPKITYKIMVEPGTGVSGTLIIHEESIYSVLI